MNDKFSSYQQLNKLSKGREIVLFGAGNIAHKTARKISHPIKCIYDNSANLWGTDQIGLNVLNPSQIDKSQAEFFIICTTSFNEVAHQLSSIGLESGKDFIVSPVLNDLRVIDDMESIKVSLLLSSGTQPNDDAMSGGGLYRLDINGLDYKVEKVLSGSCHSILKLDDSFFTVDDELGIIKLDSFFKPKVLAELPKGSRGHGLAYHEKSQSFFVACSYLDKVLRFDKHYQLIQEYPLSVKAGMEGGPFHHTNDCLVVGDSLYVSMFSETGNWKRDVFDGAVVEFDIDSGQRIGTVIQDLWMPHNIAFIDGSLTVLDSLRGGLVKNNSQTVGKFPAFSRGLATDGVHFFIGQSRNRNFSKNIGVSLNISIDTGVVIFDETTKVSRFVQLPSTISEIHSICII